MKIEFTEEGGKRQVCFSLQKETAASHELRMLTENQIPYLAEAHVKNVNGQTRLFYDVSGAVSLLEEEEEGTLSAMVRAVFFSMARLQDTLSDYLLRPEGLLLSPEAIFLIEERGEVLFLYHPEAEENVQQSLEVLTSWLIQVLTPKKQEEILLLYGLYKKAREANVTLKSLADYWQTAAGGGEIVLTDPETSWETAATEAEREQMQELFGYEEEAEEDALPEERALLEEDEESYLPVVSEGAYLPAESAFNAPQKSFFTRLKPYLFELFLAAVLVAAAVIFLLY